LESRGLPSEEGPGQHREELKASSGHGSRIPSLDGLRAISILLVILAHLSGSPGFVDFGPLVSDSMGNLGVRTFFVISGFLITSLLLHEESKYGRIRLRDFYVRRIARIFPAFYVYLLVLAATAGTGLILLKSNDLIEAATYTVNYFTWSSQSNYVRHIWSLSVEEQFYLLWPAALVFLGVLRARYLATFIVVASPFYRLLVWLLVPAFRLTIDRRFDCIADCIAVGCLLACVGRDLASRPRYMSFLNSFAFGLVPIAVITGSLAANHPKIYYGVAQTVINLGLALVVHRSVLLKDSLSGRFLNFVPIAYVGTLSYSLYLWQQLFLSEQVGVWRFAFPYNLALAGGAALLSFYVVEQPLRSAITARFQKSPRRPATSRAGDAPAA
jgi:peptidoglycan/LPS O-acetylase OafA/YrhL